MKMNKYFLCLLFLLGYATKSISQTNQIQQIITGNYGEWEELYKHLHTNPELSLQEENTSAVMSKALSDLGFEVTPEVGGYGVAGVLRNGDGPVVMIRSDMDALPIKEETGAGFASNVTVLSDVGEETPVMHACGHDMHMTAMIGTAQILSHLKDQWRGTLVFVAQPAEEIGAGSQAMIDDGLFERFPRPDYALALHVNSAMESGKVGITPGYAYASVDEIRILIHGRGGHGAYPHLTVDPVIIASKLVLDLQTIVSREVSAFESAVLSVGAVRSGNSFNTVPEEAELRLTLRTFKREVREKMIRRIKEMAEAAGRAAGLAEGEWPEVLAEDQPLPEVYNSPELSATITEVFKKILGDENVVDLPPVMYGEDFGRYGRVEPKIPILLYSVGAINPELYQQAESEGIEIPSTHSGRFLPDVEATLKTGVLTMSSAVLKLLDEK